MDDEDEVEDEDDEEEVEEVEEYDDDDLDEDPDEDDPDDEDEEDEEDQDPGYLGFDDLSAREKRELVRSYFDLPTYQREDGSVDLGAVSKELGLTLASARGYYLHWRKEKNRALPPATQQKMEKDMDVVFGPRVDQPQAAPPPPPDNGQPQPYQMQAAPPGMEGGNGSFMWNMMQQQQAQSDREWQKQRYYDEQRRIDERRAEDRRQTLDKESNIQQQKMMNRTFGLLEKQITGGGGGSFLGITDPDVAGPLKEKFVDQLMGGGEEKSETAMVLEYLKDSEVDKEIVGLIRDWRRDDPKYDPYGGDAKDDVPRNEDGSVDETQLELKPEVYIKEMNEMFLPRCKDDREKQAVEQQISITVNSVVEEYQDQEGMTPTGLSKIMGARFNIIRMVRNMGMQLKKVVKKKKTAEVLAEELWEYSPEWAEQLGKVEYKTILDIVSLYTSTGGVAKDYAFLSKPEVTEVGEKVIELLKDVEEAKAQ